jgi:drug/metabolite transporter (DMT)-like permease
VLALLSKYFLHEQISWARWAGIAMIVAGVMTIRNAYSNPNVTTRDRGDDLSGLQPVKA